MGQSKWKSIRQVRKTLSLFPVGKNVYYPPYMAKRATFRP